MTEDDAGRDLTELTSYIVASYVSNHRLGVYELAELIGSVHGTLAGIQSGNVVTEPEVQQPAVPVKKSVMPDYIICLEDGKKFKSLKRHLRTAYGLTPDQYRAKWGLPANYPMVAPSYAKARSDLAKRMGLGQPRREEEEEVAPPVPVKAAPRKRAAAREA